MANSPEEKTFEKKPRPETGSSAKQREGDEVVAAPVDDKDDKDDNGVSAEQPQPPRARSSAPYQESDAEPRGERHISFEEKIRAFKKQSEERLLHIKRSREAKIGKKKPR